MKQKVIVIRMKSMLISMLLFLFCSSVLAQPAGNRAIEDAYVDQIGDCSRVTIDFVFPVQYLSHFPKETGKELQVSLRPLAVGGSNVAALVFNESIRIVDDLSVDLSRFEYIGDRFPSDPYLWLVSPDEFNFRIEQGSDFRSLVLFITPGPIANCN
jgi:hypothetical protein